MCLVLGGVLDGFGVPMERGRCLEEVIGLLKRLPVHHHVGHALRVQHPVMQLLFCFLKKKCMAVGHFVRPFAAYESSLFGRKSRFDVRNVG